METNSKKETIPFVATHPSEIIADEIKARGMKKTEFAERMGMQKPNVTRLLKGIGYSGRHVDEASIAI